MNYFESALRAPIAGERSRRGFTLLELIVVITIIGIIGTFVLTRIAGSTQKARITKVRHDLKAIYQASTAFEAQTGNWPESIEELVNATDPDTQAPIPGTLESLPRDAWGNEYVYELGDYSPIISCLGKDGSPGGEGENQDLSWPEESDTGY